MSWIAIEIAFGPDWTEGELEAASGLLGQTGTIGWLEDPTPNGRIAWKAFYDADAEDPEAAVREALSGIGANGLERFSLQVETVTEEDWMEGYRRYFRPTAVSKRFAVAPPTFDGEWPFPTRERLTINPGMAFGTGTHASTRLTLEALEELGCEGRSVLDVGTGSGILAIAAARMGATCVLGVEIDPNALENAEENRALNGLEDRVEFLCAGPDSVKDFAFDVVLANILYANLEPLLPDLKRLLADSPDSRLVLAGFLLAEKEVVANDLARQGLTSEHWSQEEEWGCVTILRTG